MKTDLCVGDPWTRSAFRDVSTRRRFCWRGIRVNDPLLLRFLYFSFPFSGMRKKLPKKYQHCYFWILILVIAFVIIIVNNVIIIIIVFLKLYVTFMISHPDPQHARTYTYLIFSDWKKCKDTVLSLHLPLVFLVPRISRVQ